MKFVSCVAVLLAVSSLPATLIQGAEVKPENIAVLSICTVTNRTEFLQGYGELAAMFQQSMPGVEAYSAMEDKGDENGVALVEAYVNAANYSAAMEMAGEEMMSVMSQFENCNVQIWGGWTDEVKTTIGGMMPGSLLFHENQEGYIDFCRDADDHPATNNYPMIGYFNGRRTSNVTLNMDTLQAMGDFYSENIPGVLAWITSVDPVQPDVVNDFQLFRDVYAFIDHTNPWVFPGLMDNFPNLVGSWTDPFDYNATLLGYHFTNPLAQVGIVESGFGNATFMDFFPHGSMTGQYMGFMKFCATSKVDCDADEETEVAAVAHNDTDGDADDTDLAVGKSNGDERTLLRVNP